MTEFFALLVLPLGLYFVYWAAVRLGTISRWSHKARWSRRWVKWGVAAAVVLIVTAYALESVQPLLDWVWS